VGSREVGGLATGGSVGRLVMPNNGVLYVGFCVGCGVGLVVGRGSVGGSVGRRVTQDNGSPSSGASVTLIELMPAVGDSC
jgi:hypothetical protein